jgi:hypothetical protein
MTSTLAVDQLIFVKDEYHEWVLGRIVSTSESNGVSSLKVEIAETKDTINNDFNSKAVLELPLGKENDNILPVTICHLYLTSIITGLYRGSNSKMKLVRIYLN